MILSDNFFVITTRIIQYPETVNQIISFPYGIISFHSYLT